MAGDSPLPGNLLPRPSVDEMHIRAVVVTGSLIVNACRDGAACVDESVDNPVDNLPEHGDNLSAPVDEQRILKSPSQAPCATRAMAVEISHATRDGDRIQGATPGSASNRAGSSRKRASGDGVRKWCTNWRVSPGRRLLGSGHRVDRCVLRLAESMLACSVGPAGRAIGLRSRKRRIGLCFAG